MPIREKGQEEYDYCDHCQLLVVSIQPGLSEFERELGATLAEVWPNFFTEFDANLEVIRARTDDIAGDANRFKDYIVSYYDTHQEILGAALSYGGKRAVELCEIMCFSAALGGKSSVGLPLAPKVSHH